MIKPGESFVDTWTAAWGTFTESTNQAAALEFLRWLATDGQVVRMETSADPSLSMTVAEEHNYGEGDPTKEAYLQVLSAAAQPQVFVPHGVDAWDPAEVLRQLTIGGQDGREAHPGHDGRRGPDGAGPRVDRVGEDRPVTA